MARNFVQASTQYLERTAAALTTTPITMAAWVRPADTTDQTVVALTQNGADDYHRIVLSVGAVGAQSGSTAAGVGGAFTAGTLTNNVWGHACAVFASATSRTSYINGAGKATNATSITPSSLNRTSVGRTPRLSAPLNYMNGDIAEAAIWNVALDDAEVAALAAGVCPLLVRPTALVAYWPLVGNYSPEIDPVGRNELTLTNAPAAAAHVAMLYPAGPQLILFGSAAAAPTQLGRMFAVF